MDSWITVSQEDHIERELLVDIRWVDVHNLGELQDHWVSAFPGQSNTQICDVGDIPDVVIGPEVAFLIAVNHEGGFDRTAIFV